MISGLILKKKEKTTKFWFFVYVLYIVLARLDNGFISKRPFIVKISSYSSYLYERCNNNKKEVYSALFKNSNFVSKLKEAWEVSLNLETKYELIDIPLNQN